MPSQSPLRAPLRAPLNEGPGSPAFWRALASGVYGSVVQPAAADFMNGHETLRQEYPLGYALAQMHPAVGIPAAGLDYISAARRGSTPDMMAAAVSGIPVAESSYRLGTALAQNARQAATSHLPGASRGGLTDYVLGLGHKAGAASAVSQMGEAAYDEASLLRLPMATAEAGTLPRQLPVGGHGPAAPSPLRIF